MRITNKVKNDVVDYLSDQIFDYVYNQIPANEVASKVAGYNADMAPEDMSDEKWHLLDDKVNNKITELAEMLVAYYIE